MLKNLDLLLRQNEAEHLARDDGLWFGGAGFSHADAVVFGFYCWLRLNPDLRTKVWESEQLPSLGKWLEGMKARFVKSPDELY